MPSTPQTANQPDDETTWTVDVPDRILADLTGTLRSRRATLKAIKSDAQRSDDYTEDDVRRIGEEVDAYDHVIDQLEDKIKERGGRL